MGFAHLLRSCVGIGATYGLLIALVAATETPMKPVLRKTLQAPNELILNASAMDVYILLRCNEVFANAGVFIFIAAWCALVAKACFVIGLRVCAAWAAKV